MYCHSSRRFRAAMADSCVDAFRAELALELLQSLADIQAVSCMHCLDSFFVGNTDCDGIGLFCM
jgi:hypothetical protein